MWTQEQTERKIAAQIAAGELVMGDGKVVIPIPRSLVDQETLTHLYVVYNVRKKKISGEKANGYKGSLDADNASAIFDRLPIKEGGYASMELINTLLTRKGKEPLTLSKCLRYYAVVGHLSPEHYISKLKEFFKYMPQLKTIYTPYLDPSRYNVSEGYSPKTSTHEERIKLATSYEEASNVISKELDRIKIIDYGQKYKVNGVRKRDPEQDF